MHDFIFELHLSFLMWQGNVTSCSILQASGDATGLPTQVGNKTECAMLGFVLDLGVDYRQLRRDMPDTRFKKVYTFNSARQHLTTFMALAAAI